MFRNKTVVLGGGFLAQCFEEAGFTTKPLRWRDDYKGENDLEDAIGGYEYVINCIAKTDTKWCQSHTKETFDVNITLPRNLQDQCVWNGAKLIQISTGCLYGQQAGWLTEQTNPRPVGFYATSKYVADEILKEHSLIIRPRLLYSNKQYHRRNLLERVKKFTTFTVETNSITSCEEIINACELLKDQKGIFNVSDKNTSMWMLAQSLGIDTEGKEVYGTELDKKLPDDLKGLYPHILLDTSKYQKFISENKCGKCNS